VPFGENAFAGAHFDGSRAVPSVAKRDSQISSPNDLQSGIYSYEIVTEGTQPIYRVTDGKETLSEPILYAFGNARIAQTYIFRHNGRLQEGRVSYYKAIDALDWTIGDALNPPPSVQEAAGRDIDSAEARNCFSCHSTASAFDDRLQLDRMVPA